MIEALKEPHKSSYFLPGKVERKDFMVQSDCQEESGMCLQKGFIVSQIDEDAILGMPFPISHSYHIEFERPVFSLGGKELIGTEKNGQPMISKVHV